MGHRDVPFLAAVLQECTRRLDRLSSQNLSNVLWSCATLGHADPHMLAAWAQATINKLDSFEPQVRPAGVRDYSNGWGSSRGTRGRWVTAAEDGHGGLRPIICTFANNSMATPNTNLPHLLPPTSPSPLSSPLRACPTQFGPKPRGSIATDTLSFPNLLPATSPPPPPLPPRACPTRPGPLPSWATPSRSCLRTWRWRPSAAWSASRPRACPTPPGPTRRRGTTSRSS
jgi:hypothetical protein